MKMKQIVGFLLLAMFSAAGVVHASDTSHCPDVLNFEKQRLVSKENVNLCKEYLGKVVLIVNTASKCGFTPQYEGLEALYRKYKDDGFVVLGFPSNDFGQQEPGSEEEIADFCRRTYGVEFPMFKKTTVTRFNAEPLYQALGKKSGEFPEWNFHKYLLDRQGNLVASYNSRVAPQDGRLVDRIKSLL